MGSRPRLARNGVEVSREQYDHEHGTAIEYAHDMDCERAAELERARRRVIEAAMAFEVTASPLNAAYVDSAESILVRAVRALRELEGK